MNSHDRLRIAAQALVCERTVLRVYQGKGNQYSRLRVSEGAKTLGLPLPPERSSQNSPEPLPTNSSRAA